MLLHKYKTNGLFSYKFSFDCVMQFEGILNQPDPTEDLQKLVDPRIEDNYPIDSVRKVSSFVGVNHLRFCVPN